MAFKKVQRKAVKMRVALAGPSGAGKTLSALYLAYGVTGDWEKIALIDTEHGRGQFYGNRSDLNHFPLNATSQSQQKHRRQLGQTVL